MKVPQFSPWIGKEEIQAVTQSIKDNWITEGPKSKLFTKKLLKLINSQYGVFAPNGTLALYLALKALGISQGDEVLVPDFTFIASATSIEMVGAKPVFVDVNRNNFQMDLSHAAKLISKKIKAIMPVHIYGTIANMDDIIVFAKKHKLMIIEDAAQAIGVHWKGKHAGTFGDIGCFSFFADKTITTAEGGFIVTNHKKIYQKLLYLRNQGRIDRGSFIHPQIGYNFRLTDIQSAIGLAQLAKLNQIKKRKLHLLKLYKKLLKNVAGITFFKPEKGADWIPFRVGILHPQAKKLMAFMSSKGIEPRTFFYPLHKQPCFSYLKNNPQDFPNSTYGYEHGICLPTFPTLKDSQVIYVCDTIKMYQNRKMFYQYYDAMNKKKDYEKEVNLIFELTEKHQLKTPLKILEVGCGTGNHTVWLSKKASKVVAIDIDRQMVKLAEDKIKQNNIKNVSITNKPINKIAEKGFDLIVAMFNVINYIQEIEALDNFFNSVAKKLKPRGIFIFDCWNGEAALKDLPKKKKTVSRLGKETLEYIIRPITDILSKKTVLNYEIRVTKQNKTKQGGFCFTHKLWTPKEIKIALKKAKLNKIQVAPLMKPEKRSGQKDWKIMFICKKTR